jgi:hypothetical protein
MLFCINRQAFEIILKYVHELASLRRIVGGRVKLELRLDHPHPQKCLIQHLRLVLASSALIVLHWMFSDVIEWMEWRIKYRDHLGTQLKVCQSRPIALILMSLLFQL